jgi:hypothetical protein
VVASIVDPSVPNRLVLNAECPLLKRVLGGGYTISEGTKAEVMTTQSYPSSDRVWTVALENLGLTARQATAFAVCATAP